MLFACAEKRKGKLLRQRPPSPPSFAFCPSPPPRPREGEDGRRKSETGSATHYITLPFLSPSSLTPLAFGPRRLSPPSFEGGRRCSARPNSLSLFCACCTLRCTEEESSGRLCCQLHRPTARKKKRKNEARSNSAAKEREKRGAERDFFLVYGREGEGRPTRTTAPTFTRSG